MGEEHIYERDATETTVRVDRSHCETVQAGVADVDMGERRKGYYWYVG